MTPSFRSSRSSFSSLLLMLTLLTLLTPTFSFIVTLAPNQEQCFSDQADKGQKVAGYFRVLIGGQLDVDVKIYDPNQKVIYEANREQDNTFQFYAPAAGTHRVCLSNTMSVVSSKTVMFNLYVGQGLAKYDAARHEHFSPLETAVLNLGESVRGIKDRCQYLFVRQVFLFELTNTINNRIVWWRCIQIAALLVVAALKVMYVRNMLEKKREV